MSFAGTPLGQNRRLDHNTFLGKQSSNPNKPTSPHRAPAISYAVGSPPKPNSITRERSRASLNDDDDDNQPALKLDPSKWAVKDTSVNVASAFHQAILNDMPPAPAPTHNNPNSAWASGSSQPNIVPRSTSVEYEQSVKTATKRSGPAPPSRRNRENASNTSIGSATSARRSLHQNSSSLLVVPDSEQEEEGSSRDIGRAKSPIVAAVDVATNLAKGAVKSFSRLEFNLREPSFRNGQDGDESFAANGSRRETSYDYAAEEQYVKNIQEQDKKEKKSHRKGRISEDNRAYKPSMDSEDDDDVISDDGKTRRRKKDVKGPNLRLPVISADKTKRRKKKKKTAAGGGPEGEDEEEQDDQREEDEQSQSHIDRPPSRGRSLPVDQSASFEQNTTVDSETQHLDSIPEIDESQIEPMDVDPVSGLSTQRQSEQKSKRHRSRSRSRTRTSRSGFSIGGLLGTLVNWAVKIVTAIMFLLGRVFGTIYSVAFNQPSKWVGGSSEGAKKAARYFLVAGLIVLGWFALKFIPGVHVPSLSNPFSSLPVPSISWGSKGGKRYAPPETPIENIADLVERLSKIEEALTGLVGDNERVASKAEDGVKGYREVLSMIGSLEGKVRSAHEVGGEVRGVKREVEVLQAQLRVRERDEREKERGREERERRMEKERDEREKEWKREREKIEKEVARSGGKINVDDEKIRWLEDKVGSVESGIREAIEIGKKAAASASSAVLVASSASSIASSAAAVATSPSSPANGPGSAWWSKIGSGVSSGSGVTIKSTDGQDVTALISHLVDSAMSMLTQDGISKPDYALHSGGARIRPASGFGSIIGLITGNGYAIGRPPVTALHHEMHSGHCWPFVGEQGQLGVALSMPVIVEEITIDHVAKEVAFDMRSAPKEMEVWGLVEGKDNLEKVTQWTEEKKERRKTETVVPTEDGPVEIGIDAEASEEDIIYPSTLPKHAPYIRIANFTYDVNAPGNTQTFPVDPEIKALRMDFGVVALRVLSNWGKEFTCLYRFRVHGSRVGETPSPIPGLDDWNPSEEESS
ncbi:hypothetical protein BDQ17DRAFT_1355318 [Cyathus striatus]|nr:hypothetical protein BDQ17DRAFT_1355318 [Cyathus striatus]